MSRVTLHMVSSLDGFIAKRDGDVQWMHSKDTYLKGKVLSNDFIEEFLKSIDCYVMGSKTYEDTLKLGWPYGEKPVFVITNRHLKSERNNIEFYSGDLQTLIKDKLSIKHQNIWVAGGSKLTKSFIKADLVDEIVMTIVPIILGDGVLFFDYVNTEKHLHLKDVTSFSDGMVEITYEIKK
ncbi:dihydrofolate reductase family protein [uncultured Winogradskyella sp.]|uniref:dihydrofolate reductase family protein n=1 Tax=uncultured Winogradskyella sp. TaxID=395353 RepID=UPI0026215BD5|nr:dihydrofolate reductase family protein [uncultured Winogradskyella sp.]